MIMIDLSISRGAVFSEDRIYRYALWRVWNTTRKPLMLIGLNPSKANEVLNDPTVIRGMTRAANEGFGGLLMANLYAYVSTDPTSLLSDGDFIGIDNDVYLQHMIKLSSIVVCGWGSFPAASRRASAVLEMISEPYCLGINKDGQPKHPLYIGYNMPIIKYVRY